jgi:hypothetical protein
MNRRARTTLQIAIAALVGVGCLMVSERALVGAGETFVATADARIGRPLTPMSYAGVARRTTRRAVGYGAAVGAAAGAAAVYGPRCAQVVDAYGRVITRCY